MPTYASGVVRHSLLILSESGDRQGTLSISGGGQLRFYHFPSPQELENDWAALLEWRQDRPRSVRYPLIKKHERRLVRSC